jgi:hypothetical protein
MFIAATDMRKTDPVMMMRMWMYRNIYFLILITLWGCLLWGAPSCKQEKLTDTPKKNNNPGIQKTYDRGPLSCTVEIDKSEMTIADRLNLKITAIIDENYEVELPAAGDKLAQFGIVDYQTTTPQLIDDHKQKIIRSYVLEPFLSGDYIIPAMTLRFWKIGQQGTDDHVLETEEIKISVKSLLPENFKDMKLHDIRGPVALGRSVPIWAWALGIAGLGGFAGFVCYLIIKRRKHQKNFEAKPALPHELAFNELEALISQNLIEKGEFKIFYFEITRILRRYIENRFGLNAPEQTTEEFLDGLRTNSILPENYKELLKRFLTHSDLVKFAAHQPTVDDIQNTFNSCKKFIIETRIKDQET